MKGEIRKMNQKNQKGITLIALVITIIVLLILAGVTINMVLGNDGIIAQAQQAKKAQEDKEQEEQDELDKGAGNIDLYKENSLASKVKVGDYVTYVYTKAEYNTDDTADIGGAQKFSSKVGGNVVISSWRVLSKKDGIVKLVAETRTEDDLILNGKLGWLNGPTVLNEMCAALYSSDIAKEVRSININDVNELTKYDGTKFYRDKKGETVPISANKIITIGELEEDETLGKLEKRETPDGRNISDYEMNYYSYEPEKDGLLSNQSKEYKVLFDDEETQDDEKDLQYWLASPVNNVLFNQSRVNFEILTVNDGKIKGLGLLWSGGTEFDMFMGVRPVVILKSGLEVEVGNGEKGNPWMIKTVTE